MRHCGRSGIKGPAVGGDRAAMWWLLVAQRAQSGPTARPERAQSAQGQRKHEGFVNTRQGLSLAYYCGWQWSR
jgi:hypothetical protein